MIMLVRCIAVAALLIALAPLCHAASYGPWHSSMIGGGGYIQNVVLCPSNPQRLYAYVDVGGAYRSDDGGRHWRMLHGSWPQLPGAANVRGLAVDPRDDRRVIAAVGDQWSDASGLLVSRDGGETWRRTLSALFFGNGDYRWAGVVLARDPRRPDVVLAAAVGSGVRRSEDDGETWQSTGATDLFPTDIRFDPTHPDRVWLCAKQAKVWWQEAERTFPDAFLRSDDGGRTWQKVADPSPTEVLVHPAEPDRLYGLVNDVPHLSIDGGATWQPLAEGLPQGKAEGYTSDYTFNALATGPDFVLTASANGAFYRLACGTTHWQPIVRQRVDEVYEGEQWFRHDMGSVGWALASIIVDPRDPKHWFFTDWFAIYQTFDAGRTWRLTIDGIEVTVLHVLQQDPSDPSIVHLGMADNGYFYSTDGGTRFHNVGWRDGITNNVKCITLSPSRPSRVYAVGTGKYGWESNQVFISDDRGRHWRRSAMRGLPDMQVYRCNSIASDPRRPDSVFLTMSGEVKPGLGGVYRSDDGAESWTWMGRGLPEGEEFFTKDIWSIGRELAVDADGALVCISRDHRQVFRFDPKTQTWTQAQLAPGDSPNCVVADPVTPGRYFLAADGVYRSDDGGATWTRVYAGRVMHVAVDLAVPQRVAAGTDDGVILSLDGGDTWRMLDRRLPRRTEDLVAFAGDRLVVGTDGSGAFWMALPHH